MDNRKLKSDLLCMISGFCRYVDENCTLMDYYHYLLLRNNPEEHS